MSEFSNSFHLRDATEANAVDLLCSARTTGLVLPRTGPFVTMVVARRGWDSVVEKNPGTLVLYELAEAHGVSALLYEKHRERGRIVKELTTHGETLSHKTL